MATAVGGGEGALNSTTAVELVGAPATGAKRVVRMLHIDNRDTVNATVRIYKKKASTSYRLLSRLLEPGGTLTLDERDIQVLDATDESITADLAGAITTTQPSWSVSYRDEDIA